MALLQNLIDVTTTVRSITVRWGLEFSIYRQWAPANGIITYSIPDTAPLGPDRDRPDYGLPEENWGPMSAEEKQHFRNVMEGWDDLIKLSLVEVTGTGQITIMQASGDQTTQSPRAIPAVTYSRPDAFLGTDAQGVEVYRYDLARVYYGGYANIDQDDWGMIHETGHALGLFHPSAPVGQTLPPLLSAMGWGGGNPFPQPRDVNGAWYGTPELHDIAAVQVKYGADGTTRTGDTVYGFNSNAGRDWFDFTKYPKVQFTIWDAGGNDTLDASGFSQDQELDLRLGAFSSTGGSRYNISIALQIDASINNRIENAVGGSGKDVIIGNDVANRLTGNTGDDDLDGREGRDTAVFSGARADYAVAALGDGSVRITDLREGSPDGTDIVRNVEMFQFADRTYPFGSGFLIEDVANNYPYRAVARVDVTFSDGFVLHASGFLIGGNHMLTAGHVVYDPAHGGWATSVVARVGQEGSARWYGESYGTYFRSYTGWTQSHDYNYDWAMVTLDRNIGPHSGWFGYEGISGGDPNNYAARPIITAAYSADLLRPEGTTLYGHSGTVQSSTAHQIVNTANVGYDVSGAPVFYIKTPYVPPGVQTKPTPDEYIAIGIGSRSDGAVSYETRITYEMHNSIQAWKAEDAAQRPVTDKPDLVDWDYWFNTDWWSADRYIDAPAERSSWFSIANAEPGHELTVEAYIRNNGTAAAGAFTVNFYLSNYSFGFPTSTPLGSVEIGSLNPFAWAPARWSGPVPLMPSGTYTIGWSIDAHDSQAEFNEFNNGGSFTQTITIDRPPILGGDVLTVRAGSAGSGRVLANDSDPDGDLLLVTGISGPAGVSSLGLPLAGNFGHLTLAADGSYTYAADNLAAIRDAPSGTPLKDMFTYVVSDGFRSVSATLEVTVNRPSGVINIGDIDANTLPGGAFDDILVGRGGDDTLQGFAGRDLLLAGDDDDRLQGGPGKDALFGELGADTFAFESPGDTPAGADRDVIRDWAAADTIDVSAMDANPGLEGNQGFTLRGLGSADRTVAQAEIKFYYYAGNTYVVGNTTADMTADFQIEISGAHALTTDDFLGLRNAVLTATVGNDILLGTSGDDSLTGLLGKDTLFGRLGADRFVFTRALDTEIGANRDVIRDWGSGDAIDLIAMDANATILGNQDFTFRGLGSTDRTVAQGEIKFYHFGANTYVVGNTTADTTADFQIEIIGTHNLTTDSFLGLRKAVLTGTAADDMLKGTSGGDILSGLDGGDTLIGGLGGDSLFGGPDADIFRFETGADTQAGTARDVIRDWQSVDAIDVDLIDTDPSVADDQDFTLLGLGSADRTVAPGEMKFYHFAGNTYIVGNATADTEADFQIEIIGTHNLTTDNFLGLRNAVLRGTGSNDILRGTNGDDSLTGLGGKDSLYGRLGGDAFVFTSTADTQVGASRDVILEWESVDKLDLAAMDADASVGGNQDFAFLGLGTADRTVGQGEIKYYQFGGNTYVVGNASADTTADFQIEIVGTHTLTSGNFVGLV